jgi:2-iminobutanoate/2-iminopropanoate deaminase
MRDFFSKRTIATRLLIGAVLAAGGLGLASSLFAGGTAGDSHVQYLRRSGSTAPFSPAVRVENVLYLSGQIGASTDGKLAPEFAAQARQMMDNVAATLKESGSSFDEVFKCTVMLTDMSHWEEFNKIYVTYFKPERLPARSAIGANGLARGALIELECAAYHPAR